MVWTFRGNIVDDGEEGGRLVIKIAFNRAPVPLVPAPSVLVRPEEEFPALRFLVSFEPPSNLVCSYRR